MDVAEAPNRSPNSPYTQLEAGWFRLLHIHPSSEEESIIICDLKPYAVDCSPPYESLSYTWGSDSCLRKIILDGTPIQIRENLWLALRRFRNSEKERIMWIDALCINQDSIPERNQQVAMMSRFYADSQETLVWLGECSPGIDEVLSCFPQLHYLYGPESNSTEDVHLAGQFQKDPSLARSIIVTFPSIIAHLCLTRTYWRRAWIVQEIACGKRVTVYCGKNSVDWDLLYECFDERFNFEKILRYELSHDEIDTIRASIERIRSTLLPLVSARLGVQLYKKDKENKFSSLPFLMKIARDLKATDLRDTVFAFFGLAKSNYGMRADYGKTLREVYIDATRSFIQNSDRNDEFWWLTGDCEELLSSEFPSWVRDPRLRARKTPSISPMTDKTQHSTECYSAAGLDRCSLRANISFSMNGDVLGVSGLHVDEVIVVGDAFGLEDNTALATLDSWRDIAIPKEEEIVDHVSFCVRNEAFWRTVLTDQPLYEYQPNNYGMEEIHRLGRSTTADPTICHLSCSTVTPYAIIAALPRIRWKRRFFMTSKGFMGLGPYNARVGDHVYVLFGVDVPFVLRRMESKGDFKIIGDCYTHGFMDGEILEAERRGEVEMERINIH